MAVEIAEIAAQDDGIRLDRWFKRYIPSVSFVNIAKLVRQGYIMLDGRRVQISTRIQSAQKLSFPTSINLVHSTDVDLSTSKASSKNSIEIVQRLKDSILYQDEEIIVLNKHDGIAVQGGRKVGISIDDLLEHLKFDLPYKPKLVHRLDKDTSGVLLLARTTEAACILSHIIRESLLDKTYLAILCGVPRPKVARIDMPLLKKRQHAINKEAQEPQKEYQHALSLYEVLDSNDYVSLVKLMPKTGRKHQLRLHSAIIGHPILGDSKYNTKEVREPLVENKLYLHSYITKFRYRDKELCIQAPLPPHFFNALNAFGLAMQNL